PPGGAVRGRCGQRGPPLADLPRRAPTGLHAAAGHECRVARAARLALPGRLLMDAELVQAGERLRVHAEPTWVADLLQEAAPGEWHPTSTHRADVVVSVERRTTPFD